MIEPKIKAGTIWTNGIDTCEWVIDMYTYMPVTSKSVLFNGEHPIRGSLIPDWIGERLKVL